MAKQIINEPSRAVSEFRLLPGLTRPEARIDNVALKTGLARSGDRDMFLDLNIPLVSAAMQEVSGVHLGIELARQGGMAFIFVSQPGEAHAEMVRRIKTHKAGFVKPRTVSPEMAVREIADLALREGVLLYDITSKPPGTIEWE